MRTCVLFFAALAASAQGVNFYSLDQEADLGAKMAESMLKRKTPTAHLPVREYVQRLAQKIASEMLAVPLDASGKYFFPTYRVAVIVEDTPDTHGTHEPVVLPGGYVFVPESLILAARDEAEFAGMLAHAMAHTAMRHGTRMLTRGQIAVVGTTQLNRGLATPETMHSAAMLVFAREFERQADGIGIRVAAAAGFDPSALARYIERTQVDGSPRAFSSIPFRNTRIEKIESAIANLPVGSYSSSDEFFSIQQQLR
jgi:predicted Zn-dependent protease